MGLPTTLKVCADPNNLPMSSETKGGYENEIAQLLSRELGIPISYTWFPQRLGFVRNTLKKPSANGNGFLCDLIISVNSLTDLVLPTIPYMRSTWAVVFLKDGRLNFIKTPQDIENLNSVDIPGLRIGIWDRGPSATFALKAGFMEKAKVYKTMQGDWRVSPGQILREELESGKVDAMFIWGPIGGYYQRSSESKKITVIPMRDIPGVQFEFDISMGVRKSDKKWKHKIDELIVSEKNEIARILTGYGVPLLRKNRRISKSSK